jgi:hypothetical protein
MWKILPLLLAGVLTASAAAVDGRWVAKVEGRKGTQEIVFDLKSDGDRLTGTVAMGRRQRSVPIQDGKVTGDEISFVTVARGRKQDVKLTWTAKVAGNELKGASQAEGRGRSRPFTAVRRP